MFVCTKNPSVIQIIDIFVLFAQVIIAVICIMLALVVDETSETPPKEATPEPDKAQSEKDDPAVKGDDPAEKGYDPAEKGDDPAEKGDDPVEQDTDDECSIECEQKSIACLKDCKSAFYEPICIAKCKYIEYHCYGVCSILF